MAKRQFDVVTVGGAARDITFYTNEGRVVATPRDPAFQKVFGFEYGAKINIEQAHFTFGGGAANAAASCARLGLKTASLVRVGNDENGRLTLKNLQKIGVNAKFVQIDKNGTTGFSFIVSTLKSREHTAFLYRGANDNLQLTTQNLKRLNAQWLYVSSLTGKHWRGNLKKIFLSPKTYHLKPKLAWNPGNIQLREGRGGLDKFIKLTDVLILNKDEATELALSDGGRQGTENNKRLAAGNYNVGDLLRVLQSWGAKTVSITCGTKGAYVFDGKKIHYAGIYETKRVDTTGAGDSFGSSFVAGLILYGNNIEKSLRLAMVNSGSVVTQIGAQNGLLSRRQAEVAMRKIKMKITRVS